ncbi:conserved hypothetical protein [Tenacibaculum litopenaei]|uniref:hypothetical protein n=1 Tax=Tenacibaculum litopenaei TaxID=396016 RepID=UPI00389349EB
MSKKPITSNLFRFVTLRSPQTIDQKNLEVGFISFPQERKKNNKALLAVDGVTTEAARKTALSGAYNTGFVSLNSRAALKKAFESIFDFSMWLGRNKQYFSYESVAANLPKDLKIDAAFLAMEDALWNQLFNNVIEKGDAGIRDVLIQLMIGYRFAKEFKTFTPSYVPKSGSIVFSKEEKEQFIRRANASVIIPKAVILEGRNAAGNPDIRLTKDVERYLESSLKLHQSRTKISQLKSSLDELERADRTFRKSEEKRYDVAVKAHEQEIERLKNEATPIVQNVVDSKTGFQKSVKTYPELKLPKFSFQNGVQIPRNQPVSAKAEAALSNAAEVTAFSEVTNLLLNSEEFKMYDTFTEVTKAVEKKVAKEYQNLIENTPQKTKALKINGESLVFNIDKQVPVYSYWGGLASNGSLVFPFFQTKSSVELVLRIPQEGVTVTSATYELLQADGGALYAGTAVESKASSFNKKDLVVALFPEKKMIAEGTYQLKGELTLSNGVVLTFHEKKMAVLFDDGMLDANFRGLCKIKQNAEDTSDAEEGVFYGVTQLGIADFRRVEQEVCCYVPGEVSHIENIMAKEYKERSTRNLTSSEVTTEKTSEQEVENLTDTSTTERNELQSEVSSVVSKDSSTSYGANASVSGGFGGVKFSAGASFNSASNSSQSNSNSQAQNYAQEVTERALERVVQKVSSRRTSRMLREFEENNKHGFDNTKGDKHVTGVYRWVDKIYNNKIINYGKRLMYEFSIPEPAKYFIDSYWGKDTTEEGFSGVAPVKPIHPAELNIPIIKDEYGNISHNGIKNAGDLSIQNYQKVAAAYGAEVEAYPENISVSKGLTFTTPESHGEEYDEVAAGSYELVIPEGYKARWYEVQTTMSNEKDDGKGVQVLLGGNRCTIGSQASFLGELTGKVAISYSVMGRHSGSVNVRVWCIPTVAAGQNWQNKNYQRIMEAYRDRVLEYNEYAQIKDATKAAKEEKKELNAALNRGIEKRELKRIAVDLLTEPFGLNTSESHYINEDYTEVVKNAGFEKHSALVKFFEQAFDWEIMAYTFYPYFYKNKGAWEKSFNYLGGNDPVFKAFLQSAMARAVVPVKPGFEEAVNWYMKTGEIWNGQGMVTDIDDDLYVSVVDEMQTVEGEIEGTWETRVPTSLTVLQADAVALNEGGLPCNPDCESGGLFDSVKTSPDGVDFDIVGKTNTVA